MVETRRMSSGGALAAGSGASSASTSGIPVMKARQSLVGLQSNVLASGGSRYGQRYQQEQRSLLSESTNRLVSLQDAMRHKEEDDVFGGKGALESRSVSTPNPRRLSFLAVDKENGPVVDSSRSIARATPSRRQTLGSPIKPSVDLPLFDLAALERPGLSNVETPSVPRYNLRTRPSMADLTTRSRSKMVSQDPVLTASSPQVAPSTTRRRISLAPNYGSVGLSTEPGGSKTNDVVRFLGETGETVLDGFPVQGIVRYIGDLHHISGTWIGLELFEQYRHPGTSDGSIQGRQYFKCALDAGIFKLQTKVIKIAGTKRARAASQSRSFGKSTSRASLGGALSGIDDGMALSPQCDLELSRAPGACTPSPTKKTAEVASNSRSTPLTFRSFSSGSRPNVRQEESPPPPLPTHSAQFLDDLNNAAIKTPCYVHPSRLTQLELENGKLSREIQKLRRALNEQREDVEVVREMKVEREALRRTISEKEKKLRDELGLKVDGEARTSSLKRENGNLKARLEAQMALNARMEREYRRPAIDTASSAQQEDIVKQLKIELLKLSDDLQSARHAQKALEESKDELERLRKTELLQSDALADQSRRRIEDLQESCAEGLHLLRESERERRMQVDKVEELQSRLRQADRLADSLREQDVQLQASRKENDDMKVDLKYALDRIDVLEDRLIEMKEQSQVRGSNT